VVTGRGADADADERAVGGGCGTFPRAIGDGGRAAGRAAQIKVIEPKK
jgi:hypothetical protein